MPWVMIALGLLGIWWFVRRYTGRRAVAEGPAEIEPEVLRRYRENIEKDLSDD
jgi:hypothetical protein